MEAHCARNGNSDNTIHQGEKERHDQHTSAAQQQTSEYLMASVMRRKEDPPPTIGVERVPHPCCSSQALPECAVNIHFQQAVLQPCREHFHTEAAQQTEWQMWQNVVGYQGKP